MIRLTARAGAPVDPAGLDDGTGPEPPAGMWRTRGLVDLQVNSDYFR